MWKTGLTSAITLCPLLSSVIITPAAADVRRVCGDPGLVLGIVGVDRRRLQVLRRIPCHHFRQGLRRSTGKLHGPIGQRSPPERRARFIRPGCNAAMSSPRKRSRPPSYCGRSHPIAFPSAPTSAASRPTTAVPRQPPPHGKAEPDKSYVATFSNRPFGVKRFQTIHHHGVDVAHGLVLLFGIGTKALPSWDSKTRWNNLLGGLAVSRTAGPSGHANSPHPSSREGHHSTARWSSSFLLSDLILHGCHAAAVACSRVHRNSVPSTQMRCMITANRRASATIAFFIPRRLAICIAQALSHDHFFECTNML